VTELKAPFRGATTPATVLLLAEDVTRIQGCRTARRHVRCEYTQGEHAGKNQHERLEIRGCDAEQGARQQPRSQ
jgi:hypothetical protein